MITTSITEAFHLLDEKQNTTQQVMENTTVYTNNVLLDSNSSVPDLLAEKSHHNQSGTSSAEETVFLPTYTSLPTTKLEEEPNPFEQSFESTVKMQKTAITTKLPSAKSIDNPKPTRLDALENQWDSLRSGILSPSMLPGPTTTAATGRRTIKYENGNTFYNHTYENPPPTVVKQHSRKKSNSSSSEGSFQSTQNKKQKTTTSKNNSRQSADPEDEEKRKNFLERNRIAALKCRQRKKQWLQNLQTKVEYLAADNERYHMQANALRGELINLKTLLMAHKDCPINQQEMKIALNRPIPGVPSLPHLLSNNTTEDA
ncbi:hypothetical protein BD770DRAFT_381546 [Pilaira anomala]|nr:hypothetical protein BD770DRAFT_381546 [Pilaira anomala]